MYKVLLFKSSYPHSFWLDEEKDFDTFWQALAFATSQDFPYKIYRDYYYICALQLVARSTYDLWVR